MGVGGGVADLKDESRHVKLGDIVATGSTNGEPAYIHCQDLTTDEDGLPLFTTKSWQADNNLVSDVIREMYDDYRNNAFFGGNWEKYIREAEGELQSGDMRFNRPSPETDKLYRVHGEQETLIDHPKSPSGSARDTHPDRPVIHLGPVGTGKPLTKDSETRHEFASRFNVLCADSGFHAVMDSIEGNRKESFALIRGVSDYEDGAQRREWQPYASLAAAAFMKSVLMRIPWQQDSDDDD